MDRRPRLGKLYLSSKITFTVLVKNVVVLGVDFPEISNARWAALMVSDLMQPKYALKSFVTRL